MLSYVALFSHEDVKDTGHKVTVLYMCNCTYIFLSPCFYILVNKWFKTEVLAKWTIVWKKRTKLS